MEIKVLGTGCCSTCGDLYDALQEKAKASGVDATITKVNDMMEIIAAGVMSTPAVIIDGKTVHAGGLPDNDTIDSWFK